MDKEKVLVILLRRDPEHLTKKERELLESMFVGKAVQYHRTDPRDYREHQQDCMEQKPVLVLLPLEKPIPSAAMEEGFVHIILTPDGRILELEPLVPSFKPFEWNKLWENK